MGREYPQHPVAAVAAVVLRLDGDRAGSHDGAGRSYSVLLVRRANPPAQGEWSLPGGVLELGETLHAGLVREVLEETGIRVQPLAVVEVLDHIVREEVTNEHIDGRVRFHYVLIDFVCGEQVCGEQGGTLAAGGDALDASWVSRREIDTGTGFQLPQRTVAVIQKAFRLVDEGLVLQ